MKLEAGKFYKTRYGNKVGPMVAVNVGTWSASCCAEIWDENGAHPYEPIISEWPAENPIRTRREIVPGDYGKIRLRTERGLNIALLNQWNPWTAEELREAAHLFNQLAEVLEDKP